MSLYHEESGSLTTNTTNSSHAVGGHGKFHAPEVFSCVFALLIGSLTKYFHMFWGERLGIPFSLIIMVTGCLMGVTTTFYPDSTADLFTAAFNLRGDYVLLLFLPLIFFYPAYRIPLHSLRILWKQILLTAVLGKSLNIVFVTYASTLIIGSEGTKKTWDVLLGLLFASIVTTQDSIDITVALHGSGCDRGVSVLMEANALIGNGVSFVWHSLFVTVLNGYSGGTLTASAFFQDFFFGFVGAPAYGVACGIILSSAMSRIYNFWHSEVLIILCAPFLTGWTAYHMFGVSGMLSVIVLGLWMNFQKATISVKVQETVDQLLDTFTYIFDVFVFLMVGYFVETVGSMVFDNDLYDFDWKTELPVYFSMFAFLIWSHLAVLNLLRPILSRMKHGQKLYDLRNTILMAWTTPKGAATMILLHHLLDTQDDFLMSARGDAMDTFMMNVIVTIALSQFLQGLTMSKLVGIMAMNAEHSESPVAILTRNGFLEMISELTAEQLVEMKKDKHFADVNWDMVGKYTELDVTEMGLKKADSDVEHHMKLTMQHLYNFKVLTAEIKCPDCHRASNIPREIMELNSMTMSRIIKAKKMSFRRQFEHGMLTTAAMKALDDLADDALSMRKGVISAKKIRSFLQSDLSIAFKGKLGKFYRNPENVDQSEQLISPNQPWRRILFQVIQSSHFENIIQVIIILNVIETIVAWVLTGDSDTSDMSTANYVHAVSIVVLFLNAGFALIYTLEAVLKLLGLGIKQYFGKSWITWNRFDFVVLLLTYSDVIMDAVILSGNTVDNYQKVINPSALRILRLARILRASRALRMLRPLSPQILKFIDIFVTSHLYEAYNVAQGFVVAQEEIVLVINQLISFAPMILGYKLEAERDAREISHEIGILNMQRPDIATAVRTRQAVRAVLNTIESTVLHLKNQGILEEDEFEKINDELDISMKKLGNLPHRMPMRDPLKRLRNMPWVSGDEKTFNVLKDAYEEMTFEIGTKFLDVGDVADGIYIIINGLAHLKTPVRVKDHARLGEIYNTDNIRTIFDDSIAPKQEQKTNEMVDYALPGNTLNEQALLIGFPRRSYAIAETKVDALFIPAEKLFEAFKGAPELEKLLWKHIVVSVVINIELRTHQVTESNYGEEKIRLSGGVIRLAAPGRILAHLDLFSEVFLIVGTAHDLGNDFLYRAPSKLPPSAGEVMVKTGRTAAVDKEGKIIYPDYAVFFLVPQSGTVVEEPSIHDSQYDLSAPDASQFGTVNQFRASVVNRKVHEHLPTRNTVHMLTAGFNQGHKSADEEDSHAAYHRAQSSRRVRAGSLASHGTTQMTLAGEPQTIRVKAAGYRRSSAAASNGHPLLGHDSTTGVPVQSGPGPVATTSVTTGLVTAANRGHFYDHDEP